MKMYLSTAQGAHQALAAPETPEIVCQSMCEVVGHEWSTRVRRWSGLSAVVLEGRGKLRGNCRRSSPIHNFTTSVGSARSQAATMPNTLSLILKTPSSCPSCWSSPSILRELHSLDCERAETLEVTHMPIALESTSKNHSA